MRKYLSAILIFLPIIAIAFMLSPFPGSSQSAVPASEDTGKYLAFATLPVQHKLLAKATDILKTDSAFTDIGVDIFCHMI